MARGLRQEEEEQGAGAGLEFWWGFLVSRGGGAGQKELSFCKHWGQTTWVEPNQLHQSHQYSQE